MSRQRMVMHFSLALTSSTMIITNLDLFLMISRSNVNDKKSHIAALYKLNTYDLVNMINGIGTKWLLLFNRYQVLFKSFI